MKRLGYRAAVLWLLGAVSLHAVSETPTLWGIPITEYASRRAAMRQQLAEDQMLIFASATASVDYVRYRQESNMMYLTGVDMPNAVLVLLPENSPMGVDEVLFLARQSRIARLFEGPALEPSEEAERKTGFREVRDRSELREFLEQALQYHPKPLLNRPARTSLLDTLRELNPEVSVSQAERLLTPLRMVKSPYELKLMRKAIQITMEAHREVARALKPGIHEYELEAVIVATFRRHGSEREAFACIIGSGPNSCILHYNANKRKIEKNDLVLVDIGAEYSYYAADITRTYPASGKFTPRQRELYLAVLGAKKYAEQHAKPGVTLRELHQKAVEYLRNSPLRAKDENGQERTLDAFFVHGLSHQLGMDVHDPDNGAPLKPGMVFTIEPGVYIPSENIGIRIEDDYLVTETGVINLSSALPTDPDAIERMMRQARTGRK